MKSKLIIVSVIPLVLTSWMIYSYKQPATLEGKSTDGNWLVAYSPYQFPNPKSIWKGKATWLGDSNLPTPIQLTFTSEDKILTSLDKPSEFHKSDVIEFVSIGEAPINSDYSLHIKWKVENKEYSEEINLERKKKFFILPF